MDFKEKIAELLNRNLDNYSKIDLINMLETPPQGLGDYAFPCFNLAKELKKNPVEIAQNLAEKINNSPNIKQAQNLVEKIESKGPYINFFINKSNLSISVLENILKEDLIKKEKLGKIMVEYSSPNTNKPLHLGHLRNNTLGLAISNLLNQKGANVIKANLINDRGIHICKSMLAFIKFANGITPQSEGRKSDHFVGDMYVKFAKESENNPSLNEEAQTMLKKWEEKDKETIAIWKKMNDWALTGMKETYDYFGSKFDEWFFESEIFDKGNKDKIINEGLEKGIFKKEDNGAISAILEPELQNKILLRGDGTSLYATNDLALTHYKFDKFKLDKAIWVVANEQEYYFKQLFKIFENLKRTWAKNCFHLSYGMVKLTDGNMKSREGNVVDADNLIKEVEETCEKEITKRYPSLSKTQKDKRKKIIALGAIKFYLLKNDAKKDMVFDKEKSLAFEGETGPYLQYTYARAKSILRKAKVQKINYDNKYFNLLTDDKEKNLLTELANFTDSIEKSWEQLSLHPLCHNLLDIAEKFNSFYHDVSVLNADSKELINARLALVDATAKILSKGLAILDIEVLEEM